MQTHCIDEGLKVLLVSKNKSTPLNLTMSKKILVTLQKFTIRVQIRNSEMTQEAFKWHNFL